MTHYPELAETKNLVLMRGDLVTPNLVDAKEVSRKERYAVLAGRELGSEGLRARLGAPFIALRAGSHNQRRALLLVGKPCTYYPALSRVLCASLSCVDSMHTRANDNIARLASPVCDSPDHQARTLMELTKAFYTVPRDYEWVHRFNHSPSTFDFDSLLKKLGYAGGPPLTPAAAAPSADSHSSR